MSTVEEAECCPPFNPDPWDEKELVWENKLFVKDRVRSILHIPLNFGAVMVRNAALIEAAEASPETMVVLSDEESPWGSNVFIGVSKEVPGTRMTTISGTFLCKVFEGPYRNMKTWIAEMKGFVESRGKRLKRLLFFYTTCPKCAKKYGRNYVAILAEV